MRALTQLTWRLQAALASFHCSHAYLLLNAGGEEAALFASELSLMYANYAAYRGWQREMETRTSEDDVQGKTADLYHSLRIYGPNVYSELQFEVCFICVAFVQLPSTGRRAQSAESASHRTRQSHSHINRVDRHSTGCCCERH